VRSLFEGRKKGGVFSTAGARYGKGRGEGRKITSMDLGIKKKRERETVPGTSSGRLTTVAPMSTLLEGKEERRGVFFLGRQREKKKKKLLVSAFRDREEKKKERRCCSERTGPGGRKKKGRL